MQLRIHNQHVVAVAFEERTRVSVLERQMRFPATEVDATVERPPRIDEGKPHDATRPPTTSGAPAPVISHLVSRSTPSRTGVRGLQPTADSSFPAFET